MALDIVVSWWEEAMLPLVENRNFEAQIAKKTQDRIVSAYLSGVILCGLKNRQLSGYDLIKMLHKDFDLLVSSDTVYSTIYSMEQKGFIECMQNGRKRVYQLTEKGKALINTLSHSKRLKNTLFKLSTAFFLD